tara:strand:+ start:8625 stop:8852 length:228 start_codon:yes stop_codon:yes gene_type:complete
MSIHKTKWQKIDKKIEQTTINNVIFIRPVNSDTLPIDCPNCKKLLSSIEDCESIKEHNLCEECFRNVSFNYKGNN